MKKLTLNPVVLGICMLITFPYSCISQCGTCTLTEADLIAASPGTFTIAAGQTLCITSNFCMGTSSNWPGACSYSNIGSLVINGTLKICTGITFKFAGSIVGTGKVQIMSAGRFSLYGTYDCSMGLVMTAVDPTISSGTSTSSVIGACNSAACEPHFSNGYAPFGIVTTGLGYTVNGACSAKGYPADFLLLANTITGFTARWQGRHIRLAWAVANQTSKSFDVDYSTDGRQWQDISGAINAQGGSEPQAYNYIAGGPFAETNFFRLKIIAVDGSYLYSPVETVSGSSQPINGILVSPNPVHAYFTLHYDGPSAITGLRVIDITGQALLQLPFNAMGQYHLDQLAPGTYFLQVSLADGSKAIRKITKL